MQPVVVTEGGSKRWDYRVWHGGHVATAGGWQNGPPKLIPKARVDVNQRGYTHTVHESSYDASLAWQAETKARVRALPTLNVIDGSRDASSRSWQRATKRTAPAARAAVASASLESARARALPLTRPTRELHAARALQAYAATAVQFFVVVDRGDVSIARV